MEVVADPGEDGVGGIAGTAFEGAAAEVTFGFHVADFTGSRAEHRRCNFDARMIHCIDLTYPLEEKRAWDETVTRISRSLRPL